MNKNTKNPCVYHQMLMNLFKTLVRVLQTLNTCLKPLRMPTQFKDFHQNPCEAASKSKIMLKTLAYSSKNGKEQTHAGAAGGLLASRASSVEATLPSRTHTQLRTHARTHDTNTKRNRNRFPDWAQLTLLSPQSPIKAESAPVKSVLVVDWMPKHGPGH